MPARSCSDPALDNGAYDNLGAKRIAWRPSGLRSAAGHDRPHHGYGERSKPFYADVLGLPLVEDDGFALVFQLPCATLRLTRVEAFKPQPFTLLGWNVPDLDDAVRELAGRGVEFERYRHLRQDDLAIWTAPGARGWPGSGIPTATRCRCPRSSCIAIG